MPGRKSPLVIRLEPPEHAALEHLMRSPTTANDMAETMAPGAKRCS
jgi:hypothetical protein